MNLLEESTTQDLQRELDRRNESRMSISKEFITSNDNKFKISLDEDNDVKFETFDEDGCEIIEPTYLNFNDLPKLVSICRAFEAAVKAI